MIIGIDASRANRDHKTGTEWYSYYLIRWLAKIDSKNQYILYSDKPLKGGLFDLTSRQHVCNLDIAEGKIEIDNDSFQALKSPHNNFKAKILKWPVGFFWTQLRFSLEMLVNKPDVLFVPSHVLPWIHPKNSVVTIHDIGFKRVEGLYDNSQMGPENKKSRKIINFFVRLFTLGKYGANATDYQNWSTQFAVKKAKKIIAVSNFSKQDLIDAYGNKENINILENKIQVVYNGYNKFIYKKINDKEGIEKVLKKYDISEPYILYIGRLERKKNIPALIESFAIMRERNKDVKHKLLLVGDASFGYDEINYQILEFMIEDEVIMPGWVEENDLPFIYSGASAFVFPSLYEGFGIPLLQAMACETPIVASNVASIPEVVGDAGLLFNPNNVISMADALEKIIKDDILRKELIVRGQIRVEGFSWEKCARETLKVIELLEKE